MAALTTIFISLSVIVMAGGTFLPRRRKKLKKNPDGIFAYAPTSITLEATVIRADGSREELGQVAYFHKNPLKRLAWRLRNRDFRSRIHF